MDKHGFDCERPVGEVLEDAARRWGDKEALVFALTLERLGVALSAEAVWGIHTMGDLCQCYAMNPVHLGQIR